MSTHPSEDDLHAYVDGLLDGERRAWIEAWLARHPERAAEARAWQQDAQQLRASLAGAALTPNPGLDPTQLRAGLARRRSGRYAIAAALLLSLGAGGLGGWQVREWAQPALVTVAGPPMGDAIAAHRLFAARHDLQPDRVAGDDGLQDWLDANFSAPMLLPDLHASGFRQAGARLLATEQGTAALVVYENAAGEAISFYIRPPGPQRHFLPRGDRRDGDLLAQYWSRGGYNYAMVSRSDADSTGVVRRALANSI